LASRRKRASALPSTFLTFTPADHAGNRPGSVTPAFTSCRFHVHHHTPFAASESENHRDVVRIRYRRRASSSVGPAACQRSCPDLRVERCTLVPSPSPVTTPPRIFCFFHPDFGPKHRANARRIAPAIQNKVDQAAPRAETEITRCTERDQEWDDIFRRLHRPVPQAVYFFATTIPAPPALAGCAPWRHKQDCCSPSVRPPCASLSPDVVVPPLDTLGRKPTSDCQSTKCPCSRSCRPGTIIRRP